MWAKAVAGLLILSLAGCSGFATSGWNPKNWGASRKAEAAAAKAAAEAADPALTDARPMVQRIDRVTVQRASGGIIMTVTGTPPGPGYWGPVLLPLNHESATGGTLVYLFRASPPEGAPLPRPRQLTAAHFIADARLAGVKAIVVRSATNAITTGYKPPSQ